MPRLPNVKYALLLPLLLGACSEDGPTFPVDERDLAPAEQMQAFAPALEDASIRILGSASGAAIDRLGEDLDRLLVALLARDAQAAAGALADAQRVLDDCDATCLTPPEGGVLQLTLDHAARLMGLRAAADLLS